jgi:hypothetical protein
VKYKAGCWLLPFLNLPAPFRKKMTTVRISRVGPGSRTNFIKSQKLKAEI